MEELEKMVEGFLKRLKGKCYDFAWKYCYHKFQEARLKGEELEELSETLLDFLICFNMGRTLKKDERDNLNLFLKEISKKILKEDNFWNLDNALIKKDEKQVKKTKESLIVVYQEFYPKYAEFTKKSFTPTLYTKIIMGATGCTIALDTNVGNVLKKEDINNGNSKIIEKKLEYLSKAFDYSVKLYNDKNDEIKTYRESHSFAVENKEYKYPIMRLLDMYLFQKGIE